MILQTVGELTLTDQNGVVVQGKGVVKHVSTTQEGEPVEYYTVLLTRE